MRAFRLLAPLLLAATVTLVPASAFGAPAGLDPGFGDGGRATAGFRVPSVALAVDVQPDGRAVAGGAYLGSSQRSLVARYLTDGERDPSFAGDGRLTLDLAGQERVVDIAIQDDGRIVVLACAPCRPGGPNFTFLRLLPDGSFDPSFAGDGIKRLAPGGHGVAPEAMAIQADGRIVAVGTAFGRFGNPKGFVTVRLEADGNLDRSFAGDGRARFDAGAFLRAGGIALTGGGKIVVAGIFVEDRSLVVRYLTDGRLDRSFATNGVFTNDFGDTVANAVAIDGGRIVLAGYAGDPASSIRFSVSRLLRTGDVDPSFGGGTPVTPWRTRGSAQAVAIRPGGSVLAVGTSRRTAVAAQLTVDGSLDPAFSGDGRLHCVFKEGTLDPPVAVHDVTLQENGKALLAGEQRDRFATARLLAVSAIRP